MSFFFRTLRSGSSGNAQLLVAENCAILIDLGLPARTALKEILGELRQRRINLLGAVVTHEHGDHFAPGPLRAFSGLGLPVHASAHAIRHACAQEDLGFWSGRPEFICFDEGESWEREFNVGPFHIRPVEVTHNPSGTCHAFSITIEQGDRTARAVIATDLCDPRALPAMMVDADLIYLECNHDPHLLRMRPNPASRFHLENSKCGNLLASARAVSTKPPQHIFLGHLSELRNTPSLATEAVTQAYRELKLNLDSPLTCAPRHHPGLWTEVR